MRNNFRRTNQIHIEKILYLCLNWLGFKTFPEILSKMDSSSSLQRDVEFIANWNDGGSCSQRRQNGDSGDLRLCMQLMQRLWRSWTFVLRTEKRDYSSDKDCASISNPQVVSMQHIRAKFGIQLLKDPGLRIITLMLSLGFFLFERETIKQQTVILSYIPGNWNKSLFFSNLIAMWIDINLHIVWLCKHHNAISVDVGFRLGS